jgi:hypothetical protein
LNNKWIKLNGAKFFADFLKNVICQVAKALDLPRSTITYAIRAKNIVLLLNHPHRKD